MPAFEMINLFCFLLLIEEDAYSSISSIEYYGLLISHRCVGWNAYQLAGIIIIDVLSVMNEESGVSTTIEGR